MDPAAHASDAENLHALQQGEHQALDRLIARWQQPLHKFAYQYVHNPTDAQDLVAETFVRLYQNRDRFRTNTNLSAWLFTTLSNLCCNQYRWKKRHPKISLDASTDGHDSIESSLSAPAQLEPDRTLEKQEDLDALHRAIETLPHDHRVTVILYHYNKLSYQDIAGIIKCSVRGVETRLYRAKQKLRNKLEEYLRDGEDPTQVNSGTLDD